MTPTQKIKACYRLIDFFAAWMAALFVIGLIYVSTLIIHEMPDHIPEAKIIFDIPGKLWGMIALFFFAMLSPIAYIFIHKAMIAAIAKREKWTAEQIRDVRLGRGYPQHWYV